MIHVRPGVRDDADALAAAHIEGWRGGYRGIFPDAYLDSPQFASERLDTWRAWTWGIHGSSLLVVELHERVVGFALVGAEREQPGAEPGKPVPDPRPGRAVTSAPGIRGRGEVFAFYLHPDAWGTACAATLMVHSELRLSGDGCHEAVLWVLRDNPRARRFYERSGWDPTGRMLMWEGPHTASKPAAAVPEVEYQKRFTQG